VGRLAGCGRGGRGAGRTDRLADLLAIPGAGDLDLARLGLFEHRDPHGQHPGVVIGVELVHVEGVAEEDLLSGIIRRRTKRLVRGSTALRYNSTGVSSRP